MPEIELNEFEFSTPIYQDAKDGPVHVDCTIEFESQNVPVEAEIMLDEDNHTFCITIAAIDVFRGYYSYTVRLEELVEYQTITAKELLEDTLSYALLIAADMSKEEDKTEELLEELGY